MPDAVLDTTVLVDTVLKPGSKLAKDARQAVTIFDEVLLPEYAIVEFLAGPLNYHIWFHQLLCEQQSLGHSIRRVHAVWRQRGRQQSALEAIGILLQRVGCVEAQDLDQELDLLLARKMKYELGRWIRGSLPALKGYQKVGSLKCLRPLSIEDLPDGSYRLKPPCDRRVACSAAKHIYDSGMAPALRDACKKLSDKPEMGKRAKVLREVVLGRTALDYNQCRRLGDAVFPAVAPAGSVVLSTNEGDHAPLCEAVQVSFMSVQDALERLRDAPDSAPE